MIFYDDYADVPNEIVEALVRESELGRLVTVSAEGLPHIGLYPFVHPGTHIEMHLNRADEQQARLLARYQPEGGFRPVAPREPMYRGAIAAIAAVRLEIASRRVKFKLGQNRPPETRAKVVEAMLRRGRHNDPRAAEWLQWTIDQEKGR